jgi:hypothetical protein
LFHLSVLDFPCIELHQDSSKDLSKRQDYRHRLLAAVAKKLPHVFLQLHTPVRVGASLNLLLQEGPTPFCLAEQPLNGVMAFLTEVISP